MFPEFLEFPRVTLFCEETMSDLTDKLTELQETVGVLRRRL